MSDLMNVSSTRKRQKDEGNGHKIKHPKTGILRESNEFPTKATDDNEKLMRLSFDDLLNLARTDKQSRSAVDLVFARKFGKKKVILNIDNGQRCDGDLKVMEKSIEIKDLETALRVLRYFGHLITELVACIGKYHRAEVWEMDNYASEYCSESLTEITFVGICKVEFGGKPFLNAEKVGLISCNFGGKSTLNTWFPKVRFLKMCNSKFGLNCIAVHLPHLEHLMYNEPNPNSSLIPTQSTCNPSVVGLLRLNPQIRNLVMHTENSIKILHGVNQKWQVLERLDINCCTNDFLYLNGAVIEFERLTHLKINFSGFTRELIPQIPISSKRLEAFTWSFCFYGKDANLIDFIRKHPFIVKLNFVRRLELSAAFKNRIHTYKTDCTKIVNALPSLQEVSFLNIVLPTKNTIPFTSKCKALKKFRFNMVDHSEFHRLTENLGNQWKFSMDGHQVELERKANSN